MVIISVKGENTFFERVSLLIHSMIDGVMSDLDTGTSVIGIEPKLLCAKLLKNKSFAYIMR